VTNIDTIEVETGVTRLIALNSTFEVDTSGTWHSLAT